MIDNKTDQSSIFNCSLEAEKEKIDYFVKYLFAQAKMYFLEEKWIGEKRSIFGI